MSKIRYFTHMFVPEWEYRKIRAFGGKRATMPKTLGHSIEDWLRNRHWNPILTYWGVVIALICFGFAVGYNMTDKHPYWGSVLFFLAFFLLVGGAWHAWRASHSIKWTCTAVSIVFFGAGDYYWIKSLNQPVPWPLSYITSNISWVLVCVLAMLLLAVLVKRKQDPPVALEQTQNKDAQAFDGVLPPSRPIVVPVRYGKITSGPEAGHTGISLRNDGDPAYNVHAHSVTLSGICTFEMTGTPEQLRNGEPDLSFGCWRNSSSGGSLGSKLYDFMVEHDIDQIAIPVTYRDADFNWYQTDVLLIKDQMARSTNGSEAGIRVDWKQKKIPPPDNESGQNGEQPDVALVWDWTEDQKKLRGLSETEKTILVHNRSPHDWIYNIQIHPIELGRKLEFERINEIPPGKLHETLGRWGNSSSLTRNIAEFFAAPINEQEAQRKGWHYTKTHNRGMSPYFLKIPVRVTYKARSKEWEHRTTFVFDIGLESFFERD